MAHHSIFTWIVIGIVAGGLAGRVTRGDRYGCCLSLVVGLAGAVIGGALLNAGNSAIATDGGGAGVIADVAVSFVGAVILLALVRLIFGKRRAPPSDWQ